MRGKIIWLALSCFMVLSLVLASCAPKPAEEVAPKEVAPKEVAPKEVAPALPAVKAVITEETEKPRYGGTVTVAYETPDRGFDPLDITTIWHVIHTLVYDSLLTGDQSKGYWGTRETDFADAGWVIGGIFREAGAVAESWEIPDRQTLIYHIRKGIHWFNKPPLNGRELNAQDVAYTIKRWYLNPNSTVNYLAAARPPGTNMVSVETPNDWTVVVKVTGEAPGGYFEDISGKMWLVPREVIEKYGSLKDWRNSLGTSGFMLVDHVSGSSYSFVKNPDYWMKNPIGPGKGDDLPYIDRVEALVIGDLSTRMSAFRVGKLDYLGISPSVGAQEVEQLLQTNPETKVKARLVQADGYTIRATSTDPLALPLKDQRVRWALSMAIDREAMLRDLYRGKGVMRDVWAPSWSPYYSSDDKLVELLVKVHGVPPEQAEIMKKLYQYRPEDAKKLLAEAGYPNGFKTTVLVASAPSKTVDTWSVIKGYWEKIGVDLALDVRESRVATTIRDSMRIPAIGTGLGSVIDIPYKFRAYLAGSTSNHADLNDPVVQAHIQRAFAAAPDYAEQARLTQEVEAYILWLAWHVPFPGENNYTVWHPWLKNYHGEVEFGYKNQYNWLLFAWLDQDLKAKMTGKKK